MAASPELYLYRILLSTDRNDDKRRLRSWGGTNVIYIVSVALLLGLRSAHVGRYIVYLLTDVMCITAAVY
jgi:hypothetical protein